MFRVCAPARAGLLCALRVLFVHLLHSLFVGGCCAPCCEWLLLMCVLYHGSPAERWPGVGAHLAGAVPGVDPLRCLCNCLFVCDLRSPRVYPRSDGVGGYLSANLHARART